MGHVRYDTPKVPTVDVPNEWLTVARDLADLVNAYADKYTLLVSPAPGAGMGAPACFVPLTNEVQIDTDKTLPGVDPSTVQARDTLWRLDNAAFIGALVHEASHAKHTMFVGMDFAEMNVPERVVDVIIALEEPRCESSLARHKRGLKPFLHACAMDIVAKDFTFTDSPYSASIAAALLLARVDGKVLTKKDVRRFDTAIRKVLDDETLAKLRELWKRFLALDDSDQQGMIDVATEWLDVLGIDQNDNSELTSSALSGGESGDDSQDQGESGGFAEAMEKAVEVGQIEADGHVSEARYEVERQREETARNEAQEYEDKAKSIGQHVFPTHTPQPTHSHFSYSRLPNDDEHTAVTTLARELERVTYRDKAVARRTQDRPSGRPNMPNVMTNEAFRDRGIDVSLPEYITQELMFTDSPPLRMGLMCDVSGSMSGAQEPIASAQWVLSNAGSRVDAQVATVHYGAKVYGIARPGEIQDDVGVYDAHSTNHDFKNAFLALDGALGLTSGNGARLLVVASDLVYADAEDRHMPSLIARAKHTGVAILWLDFRGQFWHQNTQGYGKVLRVRDVSPSDVATLIGNAAIEELKALDASRQ